MVGSYIYGAEKNEIAIYENDCFYNLKDLTTLVDDQGKIWDSIDYIVDINDHGWMIAQGKINGATHALLLKPVY
jgi:hypothetical protein